MWESGLMKVTLEIPDDLFKRIKTTAAMQGESFRSFVTDALQAHLERQPSGASVRGWRSVFGEARQEEVESVDAVIAEAFEQIDPDKWR
jgi:metal-responsive CopG/Arc/MetJ family transcriptional regulator